jgi:ornithine cyclodeaminase/alanine dehydrogenase-like protein (mu-crystallin family)
MPDTLARDTLVLSRHDVRRLMSMDECIDAVENAFRDHAFGRSISPGILGSHVPGGGFHVKTAGLATDRQSVFVAKVNANFPGNPSRFGLPTIQGVIVMYDAINGRPLAILDSIEITSVRTAAASAVAARHLARGDAATATICGCGEQGRSQLRALTRVRRIQRVLAFDTDFAKAERYAQELSPELDIDITPVGELGAETRRSDIWATCTTSRRWFVGRDNVAPGSLVLAVGADNEDKQEIEPALLAETTVVADVLDQCAAFGDLHHALELGVMRRENVHAELADVVSGRRPGRQRDEEIIVFDSTGTALQDVAAAQLVYQRAVATGVGMYVDLVGSAAPNVHAVAHR